MEKFRLTQAQSLLRDAASTKKTKERLNPPKDGTIRVDIFEKILNDLFDAEDFIYSSRPSHKLDQNNAEMFIAKIIDARKSIDEIMSDFGVIDKKDSKEDVKEYSKDMLILTTKNSFKKTIVKFGFDPQRIVVAGVPLDIEDMKILNPKIPENALEPIIKKITHVKHDIERKLDQFDLDTVVVLTENDKQGEMLGKRAKTLYNARLITSENLKDITTEKFIELLS